MIEARAAVTLRNNGWTDTDIRKLLRIGRSTFYNRLVVAREVEDRARHREGRADECK
jgi:hypothetical protein